MIFDNVYINSFQLKNGLFPVKEGFLYSVDVDGYPMCVVGERKSREDYEAIKLEEQKKYPEAIAKLERRNVDAFISDVLHDRQAGGGSSVYGRISEMAAAVDGCFEY